MRLLHTSDWHLGQSFHEHDRQAEHQAFLDGLLHCLAQEQPDALLIAGDLYDSSNPPASAQHQFHRFLIAARAALPRLRIVLIAGNHDAPGRLDAMAPLLQLLDATVIGQVPRQPDQSPDLDRMLLPLPGPDGAIAAWCLALPFLRPADVPRCPDAADPYQAGIVALYRQLQERALARRQPGQALIAMGHCHMQHGEVSQDSERPLVIGGAEALPASLFGPELAYVALGHLHRAQQVGGQSRLRYSGSPLPLSFAEIDYPHQLLRIDLDGEQLREVRSLPVARPVPLLRVPSRPAPLPQVEAELAALQLPEDGPPPYLEVRVRLDAPEPDLRRRIETALGDRRVRLARIEVSRSARSEDLELPGYSLDELARLAPEQVFARLCQEKIGPDTPERPGLVAELEQAFRELGQAESP
ncbi:MAG: Exonuclease SbcD [Pseudomonadota bacterium]